MKTLYLAHNFGNRKKIRKWELNMESKYNVNFDNPFYDHDRSDVKTLDQVKDGSKEQLEMFRTRNTPEKVDEIVNGDLEYIRKSDGIIAYAGTSNKFSTNIGTPMEIFWAAKILEIPVYVITNKYGFHPWILKYATKIFKSLAEFEQFTRETFGLKKGL
jgi:hypothetical protein